MKDTENYIVEFSGPTEMTKNRFEGEFSLRLSFERQIKNESRKHRGRFAKMEPFYALTDRVDQNGMNYATRFVTEGASGPHLLLTHHL